MISSQVIDLRSDTVTRPTNEMREAAATAQVGDDVYGEDPSVNELEDYAAKLLGKEAALFVSSGTQGNLISILSQTSTGDEVLLEENSHIFYYEVGGISAVGGVMPRTYKSEKGYIRSHEFDKIIRKDDIHFPNPTVFCIENTHNRHGGIALSAQEVSEMAKSAHDNNLKVHLDGARIFNATTYHNIDVKEYTKHVDSIQICLSKGLSAPIGSIVAGDNSFIEKARKKRKLLGGGMRQVGIIAAPGLIALRDMRERLVIDHINARQLSEGLTDLGINVWPTQTNIIICDISNILESSKEATEKLRTRNIFVSAYGQNLVRLTTHRHIVEENIPIIIDTISKLWFE
ncbi:MAG: L-allo-threonine aldolase [Candidatus Heimdallarchaeota archaeon LC_2]|nr:MAG: L-allo-threonine aldolase [Candidatus Heimdallarchaeota archaeon LC_2]